MVLHLSNKTKQHNTLKKKKNNSQDQTLLLEMDLNPSTSTNHVRVRHGLSPPIGRSRKGDNRIAGHTSNPPTIQRQLFNTDRTATTGQNPNGPDLTIVREIAELKLSLQDIHSKIHHIMSSTPQIDRVLAETLRTPISLRPMEKLCFPPFAGNSDPSEHQHSYLAARISILLILYSVDLYFPGQLCEHCRIYSAYFLICNRQTFLINRKCLRTNPPTSFPILLESDQARFKHLFKRIKPSLIILLHIGATSRIALTQPKKAQ
ncbi:hypothetical protein F2Q70_00033103 [Brassica cretica]|uniref:Uncharacterized protein n=1 Tax=Brassica cretica TaxID=69181 RepID=A0A8S9FHC7_BRACR|nr:hypothetical protein F2Q70_00033103 [Brassica cretica]